MDVNGDLRVTGNLVVEGTSTSLQVSTVEVEDKNIEIAKASVLLSNADLDGAGIVIKSSSSDKTILWENTGSNIAVSENLKIASGKVYKIGTDTVLSTTEIGTTVVSALGLTQIGTLQYLDVDNINLNNNTISVSGSGLQIDSAGDINVVNNNKIVNLGNPTDPQDAATKFYVDSTIEAYPISLALDITGLNDTQIGLVINDVAPATLYDNGKTARIHTFYYSGVSVIRGLKLYTVSGGNWVFTQNLVSSV